MLNKLKKQIEENFTKLNPKQQIWVIRILIVLGLSLISRTALDLWPNIGTVAIKVIICTILIFYYAKGFTLFPSLRGARKWLPLLYSSAWLNYTVLFANGGFMPVAGRETIEGIYIPMEGANLIWLGDWLPGKFSPGDVLMLISLLGILITSMIQRQQPQNQIEESHPAEEYSL